MMVIDIPPFAIFFAGAMAALMLRSRNLSLWCVAVPIISGAVLIGSSVSEVDYRIAIAGFELHYWRPDRLSLLFGYVFHIAAIFGGIFAWRRTEPLFKSASLIYIGSGIGAVFSGDLISLFIFWELMALSSAYLIFEQGSKRALQAGLRYLVIHVISGLLLIIGSLVHYMTTGSLEFGNIGLSTTASTLIFLAFGIKCAFPLLHNWLVDAYPESSPEGTVFLSAITTKVAVYALARSFPGTEMLVYIGAVMSCFPIFYAVIENDLRRVLSYSMISQIGFMVCGIGIGTELAINGAVAHAFYDIIFKGLLMMSMGAVLYRTGKIKASDLGGLFRSMPRTTALCLVGAAAISALPFFSGFVSKGMVMSAANYEGRHIVWIVLLFSSAGVFHHAGIKIPFFAFFAHDSGIRCKEAPTSMLIAMFIAAVGCIAVGKFPEYLYSILPYPTSYKAYDATHILAQIQLLLFSALAFAWMKFTGIYPHELRSTNIDSEWVYRRWLPRLYRSTSGVMQILLADFYQMLHRAAGRIHQAVLRTAGRKSQLGREWTFDLMGLSIVVVFAAFLFYLLFF